MDKNVFHHYELESCLQWIIRNDFKRVILQFKPAEIGDSTEVLELLEGEYANRNNHEKFLDLYVTQSNTCCVDLVVTQHISDVDAIIHFGKVCLSKPHLANQDKELPILFIFKHVRQEPDVFRSNVQEINNQIGSIVKVQSNCPVCLLYDTNLIDFVESFHHDFDESLFEIGKLIFPSPDWSMGREQLISYQTDYKLGHFGFSRPFDNFKSVVYLGEKPAINLVLQMPSNVWKINCQTDVLPEKLNVSRVLSKRMALVDRLREDEELKFGVIITNPLPDFGEIAERLESYAKTRKHVLYFITMIQTIDECKIGNFDLCDAFVVINNCTCSMILESLYFNRPIISDIEFKLACGFEAVYGRLLWPKSDSHQSEDDLINKRKVSDISLALVHDRNELLERCSTARSRLWSGLDYKQADSRDAGDKGLSIEEGLEGLSIREGLHGIASTYESEPLKPPRDNAQ